MAGIEEEGVCDDAVFRTLYHINLLGLYIDAHVLVDNSNAALPGYGYGHAVLGDGIHGGTHDRHIQLDFSGKVGGEIHVCRQNITLCRDQQHIVKGKPFTYKAAGIKFAETHMKKPLSKL